MAEANNKVSVKTEKPASTQARWLFERVRREMDSLFEDFFLADVQRSVSRC